MQCDALTCKHNNIITHCDITMDSKNITHHDFIKDTPSNAINHCDFIMSGYCDVILIDLHWPDLSPFGEHIPVYW